MNFKDTKLLISQPAIDGQEGTFELRFPQSYLSNGNDGIALHQLTCYYSWFNITNAFNNRRISYIFNGVQYDVDFPEGFYTVDDINYYLQMIMRQNGHYLVDTAGAYVYYLKVETNPTYYSITLTLDVVPAVLPAGWSNPNNMALTGLTMSLKVGDSNSLFGDLIGFTAGTYPNAPLAQKFQMNSNKTPQISPITIILVHCDWINDTRFSYVGDVLDQFSPDKTFASQIQYNPPVILHTPVKGGRYDSIRIRLTDQLNRPLMMRDKSDVLIALSLRSYF